MTAAKMVFWRRRRPANCLAGFLRLVFSTLLFSADNLQSAISATNPAKINLTEQKAAAARAGGSAVRMVRPATCLRLTTAAEKDRKLRSLGRRESQSRRRKACLAFHLCLLSPGGAPSQPAGD